MKAVAQGYALDTSWLVEEARVVALFSGGGWVETRQAAGCEGCSARGGCSSTILLRWNRSPRLALYTDEPLRLGDMIKVGVPSGNFLKAATMLYGFPLVAAILAGGVAEWLTGAGHGSVPLAFVGGLGLGVVLGRYFLRRRQKHYHPQLLAIIGSPS